MTEEPKKLRKSHDQFLTGALGGVAEHLDMDPTVVRVVYALLCLLTGFVPAILVYIILVLVMPEPA